MKEECCEGGRGGGAVSPASSVGCCQAFCCSGATMYCWEGCQVTGSGTTTTAACCWGGAEECQALRSGGGVTEAEEKGCCCCWLACRASAGRKGCMAGCLAGCCAHAASPEPNAGFGCMGGCMRVCGCMAVAYPRCTKACCCCAIPGACCCCCCCCCCCGCIPCCTMP